ncbi:RNA polymerase sigma factor [Pedobacter jeongneungensis]|uniref:RNA polymerase sigma factor n=1 Tax=Pedobacter jeongneungensis TaxID=947309 RepID=UPI0004684BB6|nr:hypothetical protein [Pedobacter jeongneungensis]
MYEDIISGIKVGDSSFFNDAYFRYHQQIYQFIFKKTQSDYIATEVVQLCFIRLWEKRNALSETTGLNVQLFGMELIEYLKVENLHN